MYRRRFLKFGALSVGLLAGCSGTSTQSPAKHSATTTTHATPATDTPSTIYVSPDGSDGNTGRRDAPLATIQTALNRAHPGDTVYLTAGEHTNGHPRKPLARTKRAGTSTEPITITGPPDAVVRGPPSKKAKAPLIQIKHSHIHLTGVTLNGLTNPSKAGNHQWYRDGVVGCSPPTGQDTYPDYLTDVRILPTRAGNSLQKLITVYRTNNAEIGGFKLIGPAGVAYKYGSKSGRPLGAIVSLGRSSNNFGKPWYPWTTPDESHAINIHHIGNLVGYYHTEFVETHPGNYDITVEYCTDAGGGIHPSVLISGAKTTVRWNELLDGTGSGVAIYVPSFKERGVYEKFKPLPDKRFPGKNNAIYGNVIRRRGDPAISFSSPDWLSAGPDAQQYLCGNDIMGPAVGNPTAECPGTVPDETGIGYTGGITS